MKPVRLEPAAPRSRVKHSTTEPLRSLVLIVGGLDLAMFRVLGVRQQVKLCALEYSGINQAIQNISVHAGSAPQSFLEQVT